MVGELDAAAAVRCEPVGTIVSGERPLRDHVQVLELLQEIMIESERHRVRHHAASRYAASA
jgi:hypothetical protein